MRRKGRESESHQVVSVGDNVKKLITHTNGDRNQGSLSIISSAVPPDVRKVYDLP